MYILTLYIFKAVTQLLLKMATLQTQQLTCLCDNMGTRFGSAFTYLLFRIFSSGCLVMQLACEELYVHPSCDFQSLTGTSNADGIESNKEPWEGGGCVCSQMCFQV